MKRDNSIAYKSKIHNLIPGGAHTYSKGDDQFPENAPAAIAYGKGAYVWDLDNNMFLDCSMGLTSVSLGHAYEPVLKEVKEELNKGVNFQRPSYIEMEMAEKFLSIIPGHEMIKFSKNGSTVTTAALKLARGFTGRKLVAFPADHPFYSYDDWFIGKTDCNFGVPDEIQTLSVTFKSYDIKSLTELFEKYPEQIACVITEPERNWRIPDNYLKEALDIIHKNGALLILDEMITGYKTAFPGSLVKYNVTPDMATWGKGIANGFSFCALTGKKEIMKLGGITESGNKKLFLISTTHGGETHSIRAAIATFDQFTKKNVIDHNQKLGDYFIKICSQIINHKKLNKFIELLNCNWMPLFIFKDDKENVSFELKTLVMQEMINHGILFSGFFIPSYSHTKNDVELFASKLEEVLKIYEKALLDGFGKYLKGKPIKPVFRKYI